MKRWIGGMGVFFAVAATACTPVGSRSGGGAASEPAPVRIPDVSGAWSGYVMVEGQGLDGTLEVEQAGPDLTVLFDAPAFGLRANGEGRITPDGEVFITLSYDLQCPGSAELEGRRSDDGLVLDGSLAVGDCTGTSSGSFSFRR